MSSEKKYRLLVRSAQQIVTVCNTGKNVLAGKEMNELQVLNAKDNDSLSLVVDRIGNILEIGDTKEILLKYPVSQFKKVIDAKGMCILPGFVDAHTHPVWAGDRVHEFAMKLSGASYMEVHQAGGGIHFTVEHTQKASEDELLESLKERLWQMLQAGTTLVECKSGYGLNTNTEVKMLTVIERARKEVPIDISSTFCGAHAVPKDKTAEEATYDVINNQLVRVKELMDSGKLHVDNIDVFCEKFVFDINQSRAILEAGQKCGLAINFHGDELNPLKGAEMGAQLGALAISHLEEISDEGMQAMAKAGSVGVILPTTAYILRLKPPDVVKMINTGMAIALGSDFNPNAYCLSMPLVMHLASVNLRMSLQQSLVASTINAAKALGKSTTHGSLVPGKVANLVLIKATRWEHLIYQMGCYTDLIKYVIVHGNVVVDKHNSNLSKY
ncbi:probable imidazolonepropionase [Octopus sinensis]|uniref:Probable imidazolonepropionase n=1 Tax=Octopus sinensis TaxID=2607531 RepID=A0A6P7SF75_9MOLL|nr:probable imidazolonepropionase [Octopus sinensis]